MRMLPGVLTILIAGVVLVGCTGERGAPGVVLTGDGRILDNSAGTAKSELEREIRSGLQEFLGPRWTVMVAITELPIYRTDVVGGGDWCWPACTVTITFTGPGGLPNRLEELKSGVLAHVRTRLVKSSDPVAIQVQAGAALSPVPAALSPVPAVPAAVVPALLAPAVQTYTVQAGDTLAEISTVFYGNAGRWRDILRANPGLDPAAMPAGKVLVIPPR